MAEHAGAIDQGTTSTRFMVFDAGGREIARHQLEHRQLLPGPGLVEHDPLEIIERVGETMSVALASAGLTGEDLAAIGVTNQRETMVVWDPRTGRPWHNAIVWQDTRTRRAAHQLDARTGWLRERTGLPPSTYFSALKLQWLLQHVDGRRAHVRRDRLQLVRLREGVAGAGAEQCRHADIGQMLIAPLIWLAGRVQWIGEERDRIDGDTLGDDLRGDPATHRAAADDQADPWSA